MKLIHNSKNFAFFFILVELGLKLDFVVRDLHWKGADLDGFLA